MNAYLSVSISTRSIRTLKSLRYRINCIDILDRIYLDCILTNGYGNPGQPHHLIDLVLQLRVNRGQRLHEQSIVEILNHHQLLLLVLILLIFYHVAAEIC